MSEIQEEPEQYRKKMLNNSWCKVKKSLEKNVAFNNVTFMWVCIKENSYWKWDNFL